MQFHYEGPPGYFIDIRRGGIFYPPHDEYVDVRVLGRTARFGSIEDGWGAEIRLSDARCDLYEVAAYGLERDQVKRFVETLRRR